MVEAIFFQSVTQSSRHFGRRDRFFPSFFLSLFLAVQGEEGLNGSYLVEVHANTLLPILAEVY